MFPPCRPRIAHGLAREYPHPYSPEERVGGGENLRDKQEMIQGGRVGKDLHRGE